MKFTDYRSEVLWQNKKNQELLGPCKSWKDPEVGRIAGRIQNPSVNLLYWQNLSANEYEVLICQYLMNFLNQNCVYFCFLSNVMYELTPETT